MTLYTKLPTVPESPGQSWISAFCPGGVPDDIFNANCPGISSFDDHAYTAPRNSESAHTAGPRRQAFHYVGAALRPTMHENAEPLSTYAHARRNHLTKVMNSIDISFIWVTEKILLCDKITCVFAACYVCVLPVIKYYIDLVTFAVGRDKKKVVWFCLHLYDWAFQLYY